MKKCKVLIIGAGPSGLSVALNLFYLNINDIIVIEKNKFPRYKCCAGYITNKTKKEYEKLGLNFNKVNYSLIENFNIFYKNKFKQNIVNKFLYTNRNIDRVELDNSFYKLAKTKNIKIIENCFIKSHNMEKNNVVISNGQKLYYEKIVFADGNNSYGNKYQNKHNKNIAMQLTYKSTINNEIQIHFGITKKGYGWVSSYNGITNIGFTDLYNRKINYRDEFLKFLKMLNINEDISNLKGTYTPIGIKTPIIKNMYYVGDAVGACDPLTLSGIKYSLLTGKYLSLAIKNNNDKLYTNYISKLKIKFIFMKLLSKIFYLKIILFCIFNIGCKFFSKLISYVFNNIFINKK